MCAVLLTDWFAIPKRIRALHTEPPVWLPKRAEGLLFSEDSPTQREVARGCVFFEYIRANQKRAGVRLIFWRIIGGEVAVRVDVAGSRASSP